MASAASFLNGSPAHQPRGRVAPADAGHVRPHLHVRDLELDRLVRADRAAERVPLLGVLHRLVHTALRQARGQRGDGDPALVQDPQELRVAAALLAQQVRRRDADVGEGQLARVRGVPADLGVRGGDREAGGAGRHDDRGDERGARLGLRPVTAVTVTRPVMSVPELVMKHLEPLITHSSVASSSRAVVRVPPASEPPSGSVSPNAPSISPEQSRGQPLRASAPRCRRGRPASRRARRRPPG